VEEPLRNFWQNILDEIAESRNRIMILAAIDSAFSAWIVTEALRAIVG